MRIDPYFGAIPPTCDYWAVARIGIGGGHEPLAHPAEDGSVDLRYWPIAELSPETLRKRWGPGEYLIEYRAHGGAHRIKDAAKSVRVKPLAEPIEERSPMDDMLRMFEVAEQRAAAAQIAATAATQAQIMAASQLAGLARGPSDAAGGEVVKLLLENQRLGFEKLIAVAEANAKATADRQDRELAAMRAEAKAKEAATEVGALAASVPRIFKKGMSVIDWAMAMGEQNPEVVGEVVKVVSSTVGVAALKALAPLIQQWSAKPPLPERKRLTAIQGGQGTPSAKEPPPEPRPPLTGLNALSQQGSVKPAAPVTFPPIENPPQPSIPLTS
jgi:hypothetical protein